VRFVEVPVVVPELDFVTIGPLEVGLQRTRRERGDLVNKATAGR